MNLNYLIKLTMKRLTFIIGLLIVALLQVQGQVPQKFSYQAVLRNADGTVIANQAVNVKISLHKTSTSGTIVYSEVHNPTTTAQGVVNLSIGGGTEQSTSFSSIPWGESIFIQIEVKKASEATYQNMGTSQILSVPYALTAGSVKEVVSQPSASDTDPIFVVKNKEGKIVFAVYQTGVKVFVEDSPTKGTKGGFAVGGLSGQSKGGVEYLSITPDSSKIIFNEPTTIKGTKGGFAVGGLSNKSYAKNEYFKVTKDSSYFSTTVYAQADIITSGTVSVNVGTPSDKITDADGNPYQTVKIGSQIWMKENLRTLHFNEGTAIKTDSVNVYNYTSNIDTITKYGRLYAYNVIYNNLNVCPIGWHVPTNNDWITLITFVGGPDWSVNSLLTARKLMDTTSGLWLNTNLSVNNITGFSARPGGQGSVSASWFYSGLGSTGVWWKKEPIPSYFRIDGNTGEIQMGEGSNMDGNSIRCIKDN